MENAVGPLHVIICHKSCTESQVTSFMGHPDLFIVTPPFGFYVADRISFVQAFFLVNGRDPTSVQSALQSMFEWIEQSGELSGMVARAKSRAVILRAIGAEIAKHSS